MQLYTAIDVMRGARRAWYLRICIREAKMFLKLKTKTKFLGENSKENSGKLRCDHKVACAAESNVVVAAEARGTRDETCGCLSGAMVSLWGETAQVAMRLLVLALQLRLVAETGVDICGCSYGFVPQLGQLRVLIKMQVRRVEWEERWNGRIEREGRRN